MPGLPSGTVTFLFTDIEGSTGLWERSPALMGPALARHDLILRDAIGRHGGHVFKTVGDAFCAAFHTAEAALLAARAAQIAVGDEPWPEQTVIKVRMALHTGAAELRDDDYFGQSLNRVARIMSAGHGGQILVSSVTAAATDGQLPDAVTLHEIGEHRLKGLLNPERLLQVVAPGLRRDFPPLASLTGHSLPAERDAFVGRLEPLADLTRRFEAGARLVSVLGLGGTGKTRLAVRYGWASLGQYGGGVWFCDLSEARGVDGIVRAVSQGLDVPLGQEDPVVQLGQAIAGRGKCLVILDNFEQVARHAEQTLGQWLNRAASVSFLVTTREVLGVPGEQVLALVPLSPTDSTDLFLRRAEAAKPGFLPGSDDLAAVRSLVDLLEGLPLAIELAAARVRVMPPRMLLQRMSERFKLLSSAGGRVTRQATLRAVYDWSWDLLSEPEKAALAQLSVFEGGFTLDAAEAVLDLSRYDDAPWAPDALQSLVHKSLVREVSADRFELLVSTQEYAAEQLRTDARYPGSGPAEAASVEVRHGKYFSRGHESAATARAGHDLDNFMIACRRAVQRADAEMAAEALVCSWRDLRLRGPFALGEELASLVTMCPGLGAHPAALAEWVAGCALTSCGRAREASDHFGNALKHARDAADKRYESLALLGLGESDIFAGRAETAAAHLGEALALSRAIGDPGLQARVVNRLANLEHARGQIAPALVQYEAACALARRAGDKDLEAAILGNWGDLLASHGEVEQGWAHMQAALDAARDAGNRRVEMECLCNLGLMHQVQQRFDEAQAHLAASLALTRELGNRLVESIVLCNLGMVHQSMGNLDQARTDLESSLLIARERADKRTEGQFLTYLGQLHIRVGRFEDARGCLDRSEALLRDVADQLNLAILLCAQAELANCTGAAEAASSALAAARAIAVALEVGPRSELGQAIERVGELVGQPLFVPPA